MGHCEDDSQRVLDSITHLLIFPIVTAALTGQKTGDEDLDAVQDGVGSGVGGLVGKGGIGEDIGSTLSKGL